MTYENVSAILSVLKQHPAGTTAKVVSDALQWSGTAASQRLGKLAMYGMIDRIPAPGRTCNQFRYSMKAVANV